MNIVRVQQFSLFITNFVPASCSQSTSAAPPASPTDGLICGPNRNENYSNASPRSQSAANNTLYNRVGRTPFPGLGLARSAVD
ncbi:unnamed protein product [Protopolystoma xenopodis]|uniref:Uncharacterized protein n=1 Tax=Protopolystoma xenopodis TaxID=117903 RepID=A0A448WLY2_9PLAT|nr:unnamed protein product [Protopolystoma xenopodis]